MKRPMRFWLISLAVFLVLLYLLRAVLLPFVAGMAAAYFLDPLADRMERRGFSRSWATAVITVGFFALAGLMVALLIPLIQSQVMAFAGRLPDYIDSLSARLKPMLETVLAVVPADDLDRLRESAEGYAGTALQWAIKVMAEILTGGVAFLSLLSLLFITPIVTFYLLRDWDKMVAKIDSWLPRAHAATIRDQVRAIDGTLAGFVRGQGLVCVILAVFYALGLTLVGLDIGIVVGVLTGIATVIPYLGGIAGMAVGVGLAVAQFSSWTPVAMVLAVHLVGQVLEGNVLTPLLVGDRIRLHPVWIPFALLAGGALFGFVGVFLAVPVAAVIGVLARFALTRYLASPLYQGGPPPSKPS
ncbi:MAG: AI-2E family transporter [Rhodospirillales bacterium]|nr:AI-2E family transporter [Rhodospirillales bacterium]